jgi:hypothetical protein
MLGGDRPSVRVTASARSAKISTPGYGGSHKAAVHVQGAGGLEGVRLGGPTCTLHTTPSPLHRAATTAPPHTNFQTNIGASSAREAEGGRGRRPAHGGCVHGVHSPPPPHSGKTERAPVRKDPTQNAACRGCQTRWDCLLIKFVESRKHNKPGAHAGGHLRRGRRLGLSCSHSGGELHPSWPTHSTEV